MFPEMALTTFFPRWALDDPREIDAFYETRMPGPQTQPLFDAARRLANRFCAGLCGTRARSSGRQRRFNSMDLVGRGWCARSDATARCTFRAPRTREAASTTHLERRYFEPGDLGFPVYAYRGVRVGLSLCNDRRWPETYRMLCLNGAQVVLIGYNTPVVLEEAPALAHLRMFHNHLPMQAGAYQNTRLGRGRGQGRAGGRPSAHRRLVHHRAHRRDRGARRRPSTTKSWCIAPIST